MSQRRAVICLLLGLIAAAGSVLSRDAAAGTQRQPSRVPVSYGYPYANSCPAAGIAKKVDRWGMYECNCTSYVAWALVANGQRTDWFVPGAMDARNWPHVAELAGLQVARTPTIGAVAVWRNLARPFGHVAYVTAVGPYGSFTVSEYNAPSPFKSDAFLFDTRSNATRSGAVFIIVPRAVPAARRDPDGARMKTR